MPRPMDDFLASLGIPDLHVAFLVSADDEPAVVRIIDVPINADVAAQLESSLAGCQIVDAEVAGRDEGAAGGREGNVVRAIVQPLDHFPSLDVPESNDVRTAGAEHLAVG